MSVAPELVSESTHEMQCALQAAVDADWSRRLAGDLEWSCHRTGRHVADDLFSYASQILAQPLDDYLPVDAVVADDAAPQDLLRCVVMCGEMLRLAAATTGSDARGWHPYGSSDPGGFAAMGVVEVLVHTYDIACGLGLGWTPPDSLCKPVLERLFPGAPAGPPSAVLLWLTGRTPLGDRPRRTTWRWDSSVRT